MGKTVVFDVETLDADLLYTTPPEKFVRLAGYKFWGEDEVFLTTDLEELRDVLREAQGIVGHNIWSFDLPAVFGIHNDEWIEFADEEKVLDTWTHAVLVNPAPRIYTNRYGKQAKATKPAEMAAWFSLDEQAHQLGVRGKLMSLSDLAEKYGGYGNIPIDDPQFREYLRHDVLAAEAVAKALLRKGPLDGYALREQKIECRKSVVQCNGFRVDEGAAEKRFQERVARRDEIMAEAAKKYNIPTVGKSPWDTDEGKRAILQILADNGITPKTRPDWPKTAVWNKRKEKLREVKEKIEKLKEEVQEWRSEIEGGDLPDRSVAARERWINSNLDKINQLKKEPLPPYFGLSLAGDTLKELTQGTEAEEFADALAELKGQRTLPEQALEAQHSDGFVHPDITMLQRSGRWSTTRPALTIWNARGPGAVEKSYFIPDNPDHVLVEFDYSNADARMVAALSGDEKYAERFLPGADGHMINAIAAWGEEKVAEDPAKYRQAAKAPGHGWNYSIGAEKAGYLLGAKTKEEALQLGGEFVRGMNETFKKVVAWKQETIRFAEKHGYVINDWGRKMPIEAGREHTQAPALLGQSGTREIVCDALLRMPYWMLRRVKAQIHDALVFSVPRATAEKWIEAIVEVMTPKNGFKPKIGGQRIHFPVSHGPAAESWFEAGH